MVRIPGVTQDDNLRSGDYTLLSVFEDTILVNFSSPS